MKILNARITKQPKQLFDPMPKVYITLEDGSEHKLFEYYPDEISFTSDEFIGLTVEQGRELRHKKDLAFLRS